MSRGWRCQASPPQRGDSRRETNSLAEQDGLEPPVTFTAKHQSRVEACWDLCRLQGAIDAAFKPAVEPQHGGIGKGQDLGQDHPGDGLLWIEPVLGVVDPAPSQ